jgi:hypothetical protein
MQISCANHGTGYHVIELPLANTTFIAKQLVAYQIVYIAAMCSVKLSYLLFYYPTFPTLDFRKWVWVCIGIVVAYWTGCMLQAFLICRPFERNWYPFIPGHCTSYKMAFVTTGVFNAITDLIIIALPIPVISSLHLATATKIGLIAIFAVGFLYVLVDLICSGGQSSHFHSVTAISIIRITVLLNIDFTDLTYAGHYAAFWSIVEPAVAIINCCVPLMRPLLKMVHPGGLWSSRKDSVEARRESEEGRSRTRRKGSIQLDEYPLTRIENSTERL